MTGKRTLNQAGGGNRARAARAGAARYGWCVVDGSQGGLLVIPPVWHGLTALQDAVLLLTVARIG